MYDTSKIIPGLIIFFCLVTFPIWVTAASGKIGYTPEPEIITAEEQCVEPTEWMKANHMYMLKNWRETVVRTGNRTWIASDGKEHTISLTGTCLSCHSNKVDFCDQCHDYVGGKPDCWTCHNEPEEEGD